MAISVSSSSAAIYQTANLKPNPPRILLSSKPKGEIFYVFLLKNDNFKFNMQMLVCVCVCKITICYILVRLYGTLTYTIEPQL